MASKTWFLCPDFTFLPEGQIALGRIIPNPRQPTVTLASLADYPTMDLPEIKPISGLRVAQQSFTVINEKGKKTAASLGTSVPIPTGAAPVPVGANINYASKHETTKNYETAPGIVFAYQLHVIRSKGAGEEGELFSDRSAFFSGEGEDEDEEVEIAEVDRAVLQGVLDEQLDGYSEKRFEEIDDESYIVSTNSI